jgi:hypothetical protein
MSQQYPYQSVPQAKPNSSMAIVSLIAGILGITFFPFLGSIIALITGYMARREIRESGGALGGEGLSTAGLVLGWIGVALGVLGFCVFGGFFLIPLCIGLFSAANQPSSILPLVISLI